MMVLDYGFRGLCHRGPTTSDIFGGVSPAITYFSEPPKSSTSEACSSFQGDISIPKVGTFINENQDILDERW